MKNKKWFYTQLFLLLILAAGLSTGCGGGGSGTAAGPAATRAISGSAVKGPVSGATVTAFAVNSEGIKANDIGFATTDIAGNYSIPMGDYSGPVLLQMSGGSYMDEAAGVMMNMAAGDVMTAAVPFMSAGDSVGGIQITPVTSMAQSMAAHMPGGMSQANIAAANTAVGNYFNVDNILTTHPMDPTVTGSNASATQDMRNYGMTIAAMSQFAKDSGMTASSGMVTAMMNDASDGIMNGMMGGSQVMMGGGMMGNTMMQSNAGTGALANHMTTFIQSQMNRSGATLQDLQALMNKLAATNGMIL